MSLKEQLMADLKVAMKEKDKRKKDTITLIRAAIKQREVDERRELEDEEVLSVIAKAVKERKSSMEEFKKGNREDLIQQAEEEIAILQDYLPEQLTDAELEKIVRQVMEEQNITDKKQMGLLMKNVMPRVQGKADGGRINGIALRILE